MKKPRGGKKKNAFGAIISVVVVIAISAAAIYYLNHQGPLGNPTKDWVTSGPFSITNSTFRLGDNVFMIINGLKPTDIGTIIILDPKGGTFSKMPFNGTDKSSFNYFFKPNTEKLEKLCTTQDLVGNWTIEFQGTPYKPITFQVINQWVPGSWAEIKNITSC